MEKNNPFLEDIKHLQQEMKEEVEKSNPYLTLGSLEEEGYDLSKKFEENFLFHQPTPFGVPTGFIPEGTVGLLISPGGCGKTWALMQCAVSAATGMKWLDYFTPEKEFKTLLVVAEENRVAANNRLKNIIEAFEINKYPHILKKVYQNIYMLPLGGKKQRLTDEKGNATQEFKNLKLFLEQKPEIKLVILDPASRFLGPNCEVDNAAATDWISTLSELANIKSKPAIIASHHANKSALRSTNGTKTGGAFDQSIARGASGLIDGARIAMGMQKKEEETSEGKSYSIIFKTFKTNVCDLGEEIELFIDRKHGGVLKMKNQDINKTKNVFNIVNKSIQENLIINNITQPIYDSVDNDDYPDDEPVENWGGLV